MSVAMTSRSLLLAAAIAASMACREETAAQPHAAPQYVKIQTSEAASLAGPMSRAVVPQNPADRSIRRELNLAIDRDPDLKDRDLSFIVGNGDVNVTGVVRSESERERINALALSIADVKSIANAVRVAPVRRDNIVHPSDKVRDPNKTEEPRDLREANDNIRKSQGEDATSPAESGKAGNKPAFDRDR